MLLGRQANYCNTNNIGTMSCVLTGTESKNSFHPLNCRKAARIIKTTKKTNKQTNKQTNNPTHNGQPNPKQSTHKINPSFIYLALSSSSLYFQPPPPPPPPPPPQALPLFSVYSLKSCVCEHEYVNDVVRLIHAPAP